ncbi:DUF4153 domain-containing protein [Stagnihabitans tardus]|uniref:DUF4173 domain-containing protein n=1 Tax=Stagnihabitans tardus TaxID=2699202 RepID=A0AAE5BRG6_9RHOB|nr:DUF4173 domain-containing protein [Stagnihabitans tardus]NBZ86525.1 DUF4173 domain-containing protein [Stagnihabitans tardus]
MMTQNGLPRFVTQAGLGPGPDESSPEPRTQPPGGLAILALVALGDWLLWDLSPGLSLVIFGAAVLALAGLRGRGWVTYGLGALPVVDLVQPLSLGFLLAGMVLALAGPSPGRALGFLRAVPLAWVQGLHPGRLRLKPGAFLRLWAFPLGGALVILALLFEANPLIEKALTFDLDLDDLPLRLVFWAGIALMVTPFLAAPPEAVTPRLRLPGWGLNPGSVLRALVVFNLLLAVQMVSDASVAIGGLPQGMSHATYAHRGAYPLLATALLAGAFALAARPFLAENRWLRPLLLLWLGQNIALTLSAALRLQVYIQAWGLSYLRVHAAIWMALVALGLGLCLWQVLRGHPNAWMLRRTAALGMGTLYACAFVNFAGIIAAENLARPAPDLAYVCGLGEMASGAIAEKVARNPSLGPDLAEVYDFTPYSEVIGCPAAIPPRIDHWQEWGFRAWGVARKVEQNLMVQEVGPTIENPAR